MFGVPAYETGLVQFPSASHEGNDILDSAAPSVSLKREKKMYQPEGLPDSSRRSSGANTSGKRFIQFSP